MPEPVFLLGKVISTTSRLLIIGPTGAGKTNFGMAAATATADGGDFLHWRGSGRPQRVLYIDGEMSRRLMKSRNEDAMRRRGSTPLTLFILNREDFPDLPPLNTPSGQGFIDRLIERLGGIDCVFFDNVQSLLTGDMKEPESWAPVLDWVRNLTKRQIGQVWFHHTGHAEDHGYGDKTREWQFDAVIMLEAIERPDADLAFNLRFTKARERTPANRSDFEAADIVLSNDQWSSTLGATPRKGAARDVALDLLRDTLARQGEIPPSNSHIPPDTPCVTEELWRQTCYAGCITDGDDEAKRKAFYRAAKALLSAGSIGKWQSTGMGDPMSEIFNRSFKALRGFGTTNGTCPGHVPLTYRTSDGTTRAYRARLSCRPVGVPANCPRF